MSDSPKGGEAPLRSGSTDREVSDLLFRASHDLKTPARTIRTNAELLRKDQAAPDAEFERRLAFILEGALKIDRLADGLASYSAAMRIDSSSFRLSPMDVLLRVTLGKLSPELRAAGADVTYDSLPRIWGDPDRLVYLFESLLLNALRHRGSAPPRIHIHAEKQPAAWMFAVRDNGPGLEGAYLDRIFRPFERLRGVELPGPGLGLAICREIVERHGGRIWADSQVGSGATFFFTLPEDPRVAV